MICMYSLAQVLSKKSIKGQGRPSAGGSHMSGVWGREKPRQAPSLAQVLSKKSMVNSFQHVVMMGQTSTSKSSVAGDW